MNDTNKIELTEFIKKGYGINFLLDMAYRMGRISAFEEVVNGSKTTLEKIADEPEEGQTAYINELVNNVL